MSPARRGRRVRRGRRASRARRASLGGTTGEVLTKLSNTDGHADWEPSAGGGGTVYAPLDATYFTQNNHVTDLPNSI